MIFQAEVCNKTDDYCWMMASTGTRLVWAVVAGIKGQQRTGSTCGRGAHRMEPRGTLGRLVEVPGCRSGYGMYTVDSRPRWTRVINSYFMI